MSVALAGNAPATFEIKSAHLPLVALMLKSSDLNRLAQELTQRFGDMPDFFDNDPLVIDLHPLNVAEANALPDFAALQTLLRQYRLVPLAVRGGTIEQTRLALYRFVQQAIALLVFDAGSTELHIGTHCAPGRFVLVLRSRWPCQATSSTPSLDPDAARILEHRARTLGGLLAINLPRDPQGWIQLELVMPLADGQGTDGTGHGETR